MGVSMPGTKESPDGSRRSADALAPFGGVVDADPLELERVGGTGTRNHHSFFAVVARLFGSRR
jgi:hypothetical protein